MNFEDQALLAHLEEPEKFYRTNDPKQFNGYLTGLCQSAQERIIQLLEQVETQGKLLKAYGESEGRIMQEPIGKDNCPSCEYNRGRAKLWRDAAYKMRDLTNEEIQDLIVNKTTDAEMIKQAIKKARG